MLAVLGLVLIVPAIGVVLSLGTGGPIDPFGSQARALTRSLDGIDRALTDVEASIDSADATLDDAGSTAGNASQMMDGLASAMSDMAGAASVEVFGVRPFAGIAPQFTQLADRAAAVAGSLRSTQGSLATSRRDLAALSRDVQTLAQSLRRFGTAGAEGAMGGTSLAVARVLIALLLGWMAVAAAVWGLDAYARLRSEVTG